MAFSIRIETEEHTGKLVSEAAERAEQSPEEFLSKLITNIFSRNQAYIVLQPAPTAEQLLNIRTAINNVMNIRVQGHSRKS